MDLIDRIHELAATIPRRSEYLQTEEATKTALVMPFINIILGYNVFDPREVVPEFTADVGIKKGEKVDYAIMNEGKPIILFECKRLGADLDKETASQLYRYFSVTEARFGVVTDGAVYRFYTDLEQPNKMDEKPFLEFNLLEFEESLVDELKKFTKPSFDIEQILTTASDLKYTKEVKRVLVEEWNNPSEEFVKFLASQAYPGRLTRTVKRQFYQIVRRALHQFIRDRMNERLKTAFAEDKEAAVGGSSSEALGVSAEHAEEEQKRIITTGEELEAFYIVKAILRETVDPKRVAIRDRVSYCGVLLDDTNRKPICRFWFNFSQKYLGLFDHEKKEERVPIDGVDDIYQCADCLKATVGRYEGNS